jgi:hypothetical protein
MTADHRDATRGDATTRWAAPPNLVPAGLSAGALLVAAGFATTWARYESLAGEGWYAVGAAEQTAVLADGARSLVDALIFATLALGVGVLAIVLWFRVSARQARRPARAVRAGRTSVQWMRARPGTTHILVPAALLAACVVLPDALVYVVAALALLLIGAGFARLASAAFDLVWEGESRLARWGRAPFGLACLVGASTIIGSWKSIAGAVTYVAAIAIGVYLARSHPELGNATFLDLVKRQWPLLLVATFACSAVFSVARVADRADGLRLVKVHERDAAAWDGYDLGVRGGRSVFLRAEGLQAVELPPGSVVRVEVLDADAAVPQPAPSFGQRLWDLL